MLSILVFQLPECNIEEEKNLKKLSLIYVLFTGDIFSFEFIFILFTHVCVCVYIPVLYRYVYIPVLYRYVYTHMHKKQQIYSAYKQL